MTGALPEVLLVGCGKMGGALLSRWLASGLIGHAVVVEPGGAEEFATHPQVTVLRDPSALAPDFQPDALVLAIKPQMMEAALPAYRAVVRPGMLVLSIAAGRTLASFRRHLGADADLVRAMPNTPAAIGRGITVAVAAAGTADAARDLAGRLLEAVGSVEWVDDESLLDAVTALSGGGPAYVFLLIEALAAAGVRVGLPAALAMRLARETVSGAGELARLSPEPADQLRRNVTSPNGTTFAALGHLMAADGLQPLMDRAIEAATRRSRDLAG